MFHTRLMVPESWAMVLLNETYLKTLHHPTKTVMAAASLEKKEENLSIMKMN